MSENKERIFDFSGFMAEPYLHLFSLTLFVAGFSVLVIFAGWLVAFGVILLMWQNNIGQELKRKLKVKNDQT